LWGIYPVDVNFHVLYHPNGDIIVGEYDGDGNRTDLDWEGQYQICLETDEGSLFVATLEPFWTPDFIGWQPNRNGRRVYFWRVN
jgi:hypothetical protein